MSPMGPPQTYLAQYNTYQLPGYVQSESFDSIANINSNVAAYADGGYSEYTGLANKQLTLELKVWEQDFATCKEQVELASTYLRSSRAGFAPLYVMYEDRHYDALVRAIRVQNSAGMRRTMSYQVEFECRPWLIGDTEYTISGTGLIDTDQVTRTTSNGTWTPTRITLDGGSNVSVSGYTETGAFAGFLHYSAIGGSVLVDAEAYTAIDGGLNANDNMNWLDYQIYVGPGKTFFFVGGDADSCTIAWNDRWPI